MEKIPIYDLRRVPAYGFALENIRFVLMEIQQLHANGGRNTKVSRAKDIEMLIDLIIREPQPLLEYKITGGLKMIELKATRNTKDTSGATNTYGIASRARFSKIT